MIATTQQPSLSAQRNNPPPSSPPIKTLVAVGENCFPTEKELSLVQEPTVVEPVEENGKTNGTL